VRVVTRRAGHLAFANRHVGDSSLGLHDLLPVTRDAHLGFGGLYQLMLRRLRIVDAMTCSACEIPRFVHAAFPARVITTVVAREAGVVHVRRLHSGESFDMPLRFVVNVCLARTVAGLAAVRGGRRSRMRDLTMPRAFEVRRVIGVADRAGVGTGIPRRQRGRRLSALCRRCSRLLWTWRAGVHQARRGDADPETHHDTHEETMPEWP